MKRGKLTFILARGIGAAFIASDVDAAEVRAFLVEKLAEAMNAYDWLTHCDRCRLPAAVCVLRRQ